MTGRSKMDEDEFYGLDDDVEEGASVLPFFGGLFAILVGVVHIFWGMTASADLVDLLAPAVMEGASAEGPASILLRVAAVLLGGLLIFGGANGVGLRLRFLGFDTTASSDGDGVGDGNAAGDGNEAGDGGGDWDWD